VENQRAPRWGEGIRGGGKKKNEVAWSRRLSRGRSAGEPKEKPQALESKGALSCLKRETRGRVAKLEQGQTGPRSWEFPEMRPVSKEKGSYTNQDGKGENTLHQGEYTPEGKQGEGGDRNEGKPESSFSHDEA